MPGHPDYQGYSQWRDTPIISNAALGLGPGGNNTGINPIPHYQALTIHAVAVNRNISVVVTFYADAGGTVIVEQVAFAIPTGGTLSVNVPALGPYVQVIVNNGGAAGGTIGLFLQATNIATARPAYLAQAAGAPLVWGSASVAASGSLTVTTSEVYAGQVALFAGTSSGNAFHGTVSYWDHGALAFQQLSAWQGTADGQRVTRMFAAPASILQMNGSNDDTVARTLTFALTAAMT